MAKKDRRQDHARQQQRRGVEAADDGEARHRRRKAERDGGKQRQRPAKIETRLAARPPTQSRSHRRARWQHGLPCLLYKLIAV
jgi:hypothetical protein